MDEKKEQGKREGYVTATELADYLKVTVKTLYNMKCKKRIPCHYLPGSSTPRFRISEVERVMSARRIGKRKKREEE